MDSRSGGVEGAAHLPIGDAQVEILGTVQRLQTDGTTCAILERHAQPTANDHITIDCVFIPCFYH